MRKIASPRALQAELQRLLDYSKGVNPSRKLLAEQLQNLAEGVAAGPEVTGAGSESLKWGTFADACEVAARDLHKLGQEADAERKHGGEHQGDIQKIFEAVKKGQLEVDHAVILANTLATKLRKAK